MASLKTQIEGIKTTVLVDVLNKGSWPFESPIQNRAVACIGSGGSAVAALCAEEILATHGYFAKAMYPRRFLLSPLIYDTLVVCTAKGRHPEMMSCVSKAIREKMRILIITRDATSPVCCALEASMASYAIIAIQCAADDDFVPVNSVTSLLIGCSKLLPNMGCEESPSIVISEAFKEHRCTTEIWKDCEAVVAIGFGAGVVGALDFQTRMLELGHFPCICIDPGDLGHGKYVFLERLGKRGVVLLFSCSSQSISALKLIEFASSVNQVITIESSFQAASAALHHVVRSILVAKDVVDVLGENENLRYSIGGRKLFEMGGLV